MTALRSLAALAVSLATLYPAVARAGAPAACSPTTKLYFGNGVDNTRSEAEESMWTLEPLAAQAGLEDFEVALAYNPTEGMLLDVVETLEQKVAEDERFSWYVANNILGYTLRGLTIPGVIRRKHAWLIETIQGYVNDAISRASSQSTAYYDATVAEHVEQYLGDLSAGRRVLAVAHSQGNLYASSAYGLVHTTAPALAESFGIVAVATPAETSLNGYVTSDNDFVIGLLRKLGQTVLPSNIHVPIGLDDLSGHTFLGTYLHTGKPARAKVSSLLSKVSKDVPYRSAICDYEDGKLTAIVGEQQEQRYTFELDAGQVAYLRASEVGSTSFWPGITVNDPGGQRVAREYGSDVGAVRFEAAVSGAYTVIVANAAPGIFAGTYELYWAFAPGANEGGELASGSTVHGAIDQGDLDSFTFTSTIAGEGIVLSLADVDDTKLAPTLAVYDPLGALATTVTYGFDTSLLRFATKTSGTHTVMLYDSSVPLSGFGAYDLHFARALGPSEGGSLANDGRVSANLTLGDVDSFNFSANVDDTIMLRVADVDDTGLAPGLIVFDPTGQEAVERTYGDVAALRFTATTSGVYMVVTYDNSVPHDGVGNYDLYFARAPGANEGGALSSGEAVTGIIDNGDLDSYTFSTVAGMEVVVTAVEAGDTSFVPGLVVRYPNGETSTATGTQQAKMTFVAPSSGTYTIVVSDGSVSRAYSAGYSLSFTATPKPP